MPTFEDLRRQNEAGNCTQLVNRMLYFLEGRASRDQESPYTDFLNDLQRAGNCCQVATIRDLAAKTQARIIQHQEDNKRLNWRFQFDDRIHQEVFAKVTVSEFRQEINDTLRSFVG